MQPKRTSRNQLLYRHHRYSGYLIASFAAMVTCYSAISEWLKIELATLFLAKSLVIAVFVVPIVRIGIECYCHWRSGSFKLAVISLVTVALVVTTVVFAVR